MKYTSTCGGVSGWSFEEALFSAGYVKDGGLLMPESIPVISRDTLERWKDLSYPELCKQIIPLFVSEDEIPRKDLDVLIDKTSTKFACKEVVKDVNLKDGLNIAELWHGKTLAYKDLSLSCVGQFLDYFLNKRKKRVTVVVVTSGDTGSAAIEGVRGLTWVDIIVVYPRGKPTRRQELMMTTVLDDNVHVMAGENTTCDGIDEIVAKIYKDEAFKERNNVLTMCSTNWARIMVQIVQFFHSYFQVCESCDQTVEIVVPTGGGGNITAGCMAKFMGLPIKIVAAVNTNDTILRLIQNGDYSSAEVVETWASAMDVQMPYNVQRLLWLFSGKNADLVSTLMEEFNGNRKAVLPEHVQRKLQSVLSAYSLDNDGILKVMQKCWHDNQYLICPHTAVGVGYYYDKRRMTDEKQMPTICIATASPVKFPEAVLEAGLTPQQTPEVEAMETMPTKHTLLREGDDWEKILREKIESITARKA